MATINGTNWNDDSINYYLFPFGVSYHPKLTGTSDADAIYGFGGNDVLEGNSGNDYLDGGTGADTMSGGADNDTYIVDNSSDVVNETYTFIFGGYLSLPLDSGGYDSIVSWASGSTTLPAYVENLSLMGNYALYGYGNELNNSISGTNNDNILKGYDGNDYLSGLGGNDFYMDGGNGDDTLDGGAGNDFLLGGTGNDYLLGGLDNDSLYGQAGDDILIGGSGNDTLDGGLGKDEFDFESFTRDIDTIYSFNAVDDTIGLDVGAGGAIGVFDRGLSFNSDGKLNAAWYFEGNGSNGNGNQLSGIYVDTSNGYVWYNPTDGVVGDSYHFATVDPVTVVGGVSSLSSSDFAAVHYHVLH